MNNSILLIQSKNSNNPAIGTGFVIHQDSSGSYVLTCSHVIEATTEEEEVEKIVKIEAFDAKVVKVYNEGIDLTVLYVKGLFRTPLKLQSKKCSDDKVKLTGYSDFEDDTYQLTNKIGKIHRDVVLQDAHDSKQVKAIRINAYDDDDIEEGNSGSPVFCRQTGKVIAVINANQGDERGFAILIEHLQDIWKEMPPLLLEGNASSPFVGLSAFSIKDSHLFFGRDKETNEIIENLKEQDLVAVVGDSGSGKSSVIKAGVIPKYLNGVLAVEEDSKRIFHLIEMRPANNPFTDLANSLNHIDEIFDFKLDDMMSLKEIIKSKDAEKILNAFETLFRKNEVTLLLYVDQFEELFTLRENAVLEKEFITLLVALLEHQSTKLKIKVIFTMRRDYYNLIAEHERFFEQTQASKYTLHRMKNDQIKECIEKPLEMTFIEESQITAFSEAVIEDMGDKSGELTLLQIALTQTWQYKGKYEDDLLTTYDKVGKVSGALAKLADNTWEILTPMEQNILQYIFIRIIKSNCAGEATRRLAKKNEFSDDAWELAQRLSSALDYKGSAAKEKNAQLGRLLKIKGEEGKVLELSHEALITQWPKYNEWLKKVSKNDLKRTHDYLMDQNELYQKNGKNFKFLLRGYQLERSKKLLDKEYNEYLSDDEIEFIKRGLFYRNIVRGFVAISILIIIVLSVNLSITNKNLEITTNDLEDKNNILKIKTTELEKAYEQLSITTKELDATSKYLTSRMKNELNKSISIMIGNDENTLNTEAIKNNEFLFNFIVNSYKDNTKYAVLTVKAWYGQGIILSDLNKTQEAIATYTELIDHFKNHTDSEVLEFVARSWFNKAKELEKIDKEKASKVYLDLIDHFKDYDDQKILKWVAKSWKNRGVLFEDNVNRRNESIEILKSFLEHFEDNNMSIVLDKKVEAYNTLAWYNILNTDYDNAIKFIHKGYEIKEDDIYLDLNLFNAYILSKNIVNAEELYIKGVDKHGKKKWEDNVSEEIKSLKDNKFNSKYFDIIKTWKEKSNEK